MFKKKEENKLVLDFGSSALKGLIFSQKNNKYFIKKFCLEEIEKYGVFQAKNFKVDLLQNTLEKLLRNLEPNGSINRLPITVGLPAEILRVLIFEIAIDRGSEHDKISPKEEKEIIEEASHQAAKQLYAFLAKEDKQSPQDFQILNYQPLQKKIAGYEVYSFLGLRGKTIELKMALTFGPKAHLEFLEGLLKIFGLHNYRIEHPLTGLQNWRKEAKSQSNIFIDVGSETSQYFIFNNILEASGVLKMAGVNFSKRLQEKFGLTEKEIENLKMLYSSGKMSPAVDSKISKLLSPVYMLFFSQLQQELKRSIRGLCLTAEDIVFFGGGSLLKGILETVAQGNFESQKLTSLKPKLFPMESLKNIDFGSLKLSQRALPAILLMLSEPF